MRATHVCIPDTQVKPGVPTEHLDWIGRYIAENHPTATVIHLGDHWDMPSLSSYDRKGGRAMEGRRIHADIAAGNTAFERLNRAMQRHIGRRVLLRGN